MGFSDSKAMKLLGIATFIMSILVVVNRSSHGQEAENAAPAVEKGSLAAPVKAGSLGSGRPAAGSISAGKPSAGSLTIGKPQAGSLSSGKPAAGSMSSGVVGGSLAPVIPGPPPRVPSVRAASQVADDGTSRVRKVREPRRSRRY